MLIGMFIAARRGDFAATDRTQGEVYSVRPDQRRHLSRDGACQSRSNRSRSMTFDHAATKSRVNLSCASSLA